MKHLPVFISFLLLPLVQSMSHDQCLNQFYSCVNQANGSNGQVAGSIFAMNRFGNGNNNNGPTSTLFPNDKTPPTSPTPRYVDASTCGLNGYMRSNENPRRTERNKALNAMRNEFPWHVIVVRKDEPSLRCSGTIVSPQWVLTSASCPSLEDTSTTNVTVLVNVYRFLQNTVDSPPGGSLEIEVDFRKIFTNNAKTTTLLKLSKALDLSSNWTVQQVCLPRLLDSCRWGECQSNSEATATGFLTNNADYFGTLKKTDISLPNIYEVNNQLQAIDNGSPVLVVSDNGYGPRHYTMCGFHLRNGYYWPMCDELGWIQQVMQYN